MTVKFILVFPVVVSIVSTNVLDSSQQVVEELEIKRGRKTTFKREDKEEADKKTNSRLNQPLNPTICLLCGVFSFIVNEI